MSGDIDIQVGARYVLTVEPASPRVGQEIRITAHFGGSRPPGRVRLRVTEPGGRVFVLSPVDAGGTEWYFVPRRAGEHRISTHTGAGQVAVYVRMPSWEENLAEKLFPGSRPGPGFANAALRIVTAALSERERAVLELRCGLRGGPRSLAETGRELGIKIDEVRQAEARALRKMRDPRHRLRNYLRWGKRRRDDRATLV